MSRRFTGDGYPLVRRDGETVVSRIESVFGAFPSEGARETFEGSY